MFFRPDLDGLARLPTARDNPWPAQGPGAFIHGVVAVLLVASAWRMRRERLLG